MYHPTTRVLAVLELLQSRRRVRGAELAERLEVDGRTVRRYITMLQDLGIPIEGERGRHGAYVLRPGFKLPPLMLSDEEALAVVLGLLAARRMGLVDAAPAVEGALAKIERVLPEALRERVRAVEETLVLDLGPSRAAAGSVVVALGAAARDRRRVRMSYRSHDGDETERLFDPYGMVYRRGRWYATGYCHLRGDLRLFRLDRVAEVEVRDEVFPRPDGFDPLASVLRSLAMTPGAWPVEVVLQSTLDEARRMVPPDQALMEETPDGVVLRCYVQDLSWMARFLAGVNCSFEIRRPPELREALRRHAQRLARFVDSTSERDGTGQPGGSGLTRGASGRRLDP